MWWRGAFEQVIAYFGGWNIKAYLICQDKAQLDADSERIVLYIIGLGYSVQVKQYDSSNGESEGLSLG